MYDHNLRLMWEKEMTAEQQQLTAHTHIKEVGGWLMDSTNGDVKRVQRWQKIDSTKAD